MKTTNNILCVALFVAFGVTAVSCGPKTKTEDSKDMAEDSNDSKFKNTGLEDDTKFAIDAADGGLLEVKLGELAQTNASLDAVKKFGKSMMDDHSKANDELATLASQKNMTIPLSLSVKNQGRFDDLSKKTGKDFDKAYMEWMVKDHQEDIDDFKKEVEKGHDAELKSWAAGKVSVLEHHLQMARETEEAVSNNNGK
jgi:putative membrane protein